MSEYIFYSMAQTWNTARKVCGGIGGHLARLDTPGLFQMAEERTASGNIWHSSWNHAWTSLHWHDEVTLVFDDDDCSVFNSTYSVTEIFKDESHANYDSSKRCYRLQKDQYRLERHGCEKKLPFICERKSGDCPYVSVETSAALVTHSNATSAACQNVCKTVSGCYMVGSYQTNFCVMLTVPPGSSTMYWKNCFSASVNESDTKWYEDPTDSTTIPNGCTPSNGSDPETSETSETSVALENLCPSSAASYVYTSTETLECSPSVITVSESVRYVTVTDVTSIPATVTQIQTATETLSTCLLPPSSPSSSTTSSSAPCIVSTETVTTELMSTVLVTSVVACPNASPVLLTVTSSCPEPTPFVQELTSCACASDFLTSASISVISPISASAILSSGLQSVNPDPVVEQTTVCRTYNLTELGEEELTVLLASIVEELTVETKNLSKTVRKRTSAPDARPSSQSIGYSALSLIVIPFVLVILMDVPAIKKDLQQTLVNIKHNGTP
ncbi:uncharacterized protein [Haliotis asinina]|uniref:uncharacterized protein n=1 Tax=Haliotis asinina TaxID=109174 RepID=UPI00353216FB